jgi:hypothetical protein
VWTKCFLEEKIEKIDIKHDFGGKILDTAARKIVDGYLPPIALLEEGFNFDEAIEIIAWEAIANLGNIEPSGRIYYEIGCSEKMLRELSIQIASNGRSGYRDRPSEWKHIVPETNGARLIKILCPVR